MDKKTKAGFEKSIAHLDPATQARLRERLMQSKPQPQTEAMRLYRGMLTN